MNAFAYQLRNATAAIVVGLTAAGVAGAGEPSDTPPAGRKARAMGLLVASLIGDAAGGPVEFRPPDASADWLPRCRDWPDDRTLTPAETARLAGAFRLTPYAPLRPGVEPFGQWTPEAPAGTLTDDTRNKIVFFTALRAADREGRRVPSAEDLARAYLAFRERRAIGSRPAYAALAAASMPEFEKAARWVLGERDHRVAAPPDRLWAGLPTCCGQMTMTPLAALHVGRPRDAYLACYEASFIDVGAGKDLNAAVVAGLAEALAVAPPRSAAERRAAWSRIEAAMRLNDPLGYRSTPFVRRPIDRWLRFAAGAADRSAGVPKRLYAILEGESEARTHWEAHATIAAAFATIRLCDYEPLAALTLLLDYGHDTDSTAQLLGSFVGALHGPEAFPDEMRRRIARRLSADYDESLDAWASLLARLGAVAD